MSLAITEKRPQRRPGGCAGIFFQLFDWNRRLAKKKLFSKKLLPPARAVKRQAKKFDGEEKIPRAKLLLIANENRGGFPRANKEDGDEDQGDGMGTPGLVARLMGLESMPVVGHEKPRKALDSEYHYKRDKSGEYSRLDQDLCHEVEGQGKVESRPQKLQKTGGFLERQPAVTAQFCPDVIHRSVSARYRKPQHKLASPLKSPRLLSRNNQARLMQAANKILEPSLQSRSRSRRAITCLGDLRSEGGRSEGAMPLKKSNEPLSDSLIGSCRSCSGAVDVSQLRCGAEEPVVGHYGFSGSSICNASSLHCGVEDGKIQNGTSLLALHAKVTAQGKARDSMVRKHHIVSDQAQCKPPEEMNPKLASKSNILRRAKLPVGRDNVVHGAKLCSRRQIGKDAHGLVGTGDFVDVKKNLNTCGLKFPSMPSKCNGVRTEGNVWEKNVARKRRSNSNLLTKEGNTSNPNFMKKRSLLSDIVGQKDTGLIYGRAINRKCAKNEPQKRVDVDSFIRSGRDNDIVSFTFSLPMKHNSPSFIKKATLGKCEDQMEQTNCTLHPKRLALDDNKGILPLLRGNTTLRGDGLSNLLEEKIRELNSLEDDELGMGDTPGGSTASILKELISVLTAGESVAQRIHEDVESEVSTPKDSLDEGFQILSKKTATPNQVFDINLKFQEGTNAFKSASMVSDSDHPSPISIFDASFSNESCSIGSYNGSLDMKGGKTHIGFTDLCNKALSMDLNSDLSDSATSVDFSWCNTEKLLNTSHSGSGAHSISYEVKLVETRISIANDAISNTKLLLENILFFHPESKLQYSVNSLLLSMLSTISNAFISKPKFCISLTEAKVMNHLKDFAFDYLIEGLDSRFNQFCMSGYKMWLKLPVLWKRDQLVKEIYNEIGRWMDLAGKFLDDLIEQDLCSSTAGWTACEAEAFQTGMDIESGILQVLVDEMVMDLFM